MAAFDYEAINLDGKKEKGIIASDSLETARRELRNQKPLSRKNAKQN